MERWRRLRPRARRSEKRRVLEKRCGREGAGTRGRRARRIGACAASRARARRRGRRAPDFLGAWRDTPRGTRGAARARPSRAMCRCREDARAGGEDAPNFVRLALGLRAFDEPVGVRGDHGARYERGRVLHDRGSRRGALGRPRARLADGRHGVTGGARAGSVVRGFAEHGREVCGARVRACLSTARRRGLSGVRCLTRSVSNVRTVRARAVRSTRDADLARGKHTEKATALHPVFRTQRDKFVRSWSVTREFPRFGRCGRDFVGIKTHDRVRAETAETAETACSSRRRSQT